MRLLLFLLCLPFSLIAQFAPPAGQAGSSAIHLDSANWLGWATHCELERGWLNIADSSLGYASSGSAAAALGPAAEGAVLSLGDAGQATLQFAYPIKNGAGPDFAVFENAFNDSFLELAFVEVSSDGEHFVRFPATSLTDTSTQVNTFGSVDARKIHNLAGKYRYGYGTPFDLEDLADSSGIDLQRITHVRIIDVVGSIDSNYARRDHLGQIINDPYPTPFAEGGFDLDGVGVLHFNYQLANHITPILELKTFPNPAESQLYIEFGEPLKSEKLKIYSIEGCLIYQTSISSQRHQIDVSNWDNGLYILSVGELRKKIIIKH